MSAQVAADLRAAADVLERDGWCQGATQAYNPERDTWSYCALGAIGKTTCGRGDYDAYEGAVTTLLSHLGRPLVRWNDAPGRTADEVIATFYAAADRAEAEQ